MPTPDVEAVTRLTQIEQQERTTAIQGAAQEFEALLLSQLMATMRRSVPTGMLGGGYDSQVWTSMFDQALSAQMAEGGGIGLADVLSRQLDPNPSRSATEEGEVRPLRSTMSAYRARQAYLSNDSTPTRRAIGALQQVQQAAEPMLTPGRAPVWGRAGSLTPQDLTNDFVTQGPDGVEGFNVLDANGFQDNYKCNLFGFELAYRAGLRTPIMGRGRGWGYFGPHGVIRMIEGGRIDGSWSTMADHLEAEDFEQATGQGIPFMIVGEGRDGRAGHVGMIDEVHRIERDSSGNIRRIEYSGWEANGDGAHYRRRTWGLGRFASIHVLELREPAPGEQQCFVIGGRPAMPSREDAPRHEAALGISAGEEETR